MSRPLIFRLLPKRFRIPIWRRLYANQSAQWRALYESASLAYVPQISLKLVPGDLISDQIAFTGVYYELALTRRLLQLAQKGGTLIGANLGYFSCLWAASQPHNRCFAFEAAPRNISILQANITTNQLSQQITLFPVAAGREPGSLQFELGPEAQTGWGGLTNTATSSSVAVDVVRVDDCIPDDVTIDLLKVDIEGADSWALMGCEKLLQRRQVKEIWYEQNQPRMELLGIAPNQARDFLESLGYVCTPQTDLTADVVEWRAVPAP